MSNSILRAAPVAVACAGLAALSGCGFFGPKGNAPKTEEKEVPAAVDKVAAALKPLIDAGTMPDSKQFFAAMTKAGYAKKNLETTIDSSPLKHDVPAKMFGVKVKEGCVVGEIRDGKVTAELMPPMKSDGTCLMGKVERPKGVKAPTGEQRRSGDTDNGAGHLPGDDLNNPKSTQSPSSGSGSTSGGSPGSSGSNSGDSDGDSDSGGGLGGN